ncbi:MAG: hypothetical protein LBD07_03370 [Spirochaetaceae bacterium]|jgi:hypothetical protein|nr:hypothetical protein [Spirochaetaceae bacterium]
MNILVKNCKTARRAVFGALAFCALAAVCIVTGCEQVTSSEPPPSSKEAEETGPLTEGFSFAYTVKNSSNTVFDLNKSTWAQQGAPLKNEYWTLNVIEQPVTYFCVMLKGKYDAYSSGTKLIQTITVGGPAANLVTQGLLTVSLDGTAAAATPDSENYYYARFSVRTDSFDTMFDGGKKYFTLKISEEGHASVTVHVTIVSTPDLSVGTAVFRVKRDLGAAGINAGMSAAQAETWAASGMLERVPFATIKTVVLGDTAAPYHHWEDRTGMRALDAIAWVDQNARAGEEYLIRVEKNEELPLITLMRNSGVTIRLRGAGSERTLSFNHRTMNRANHYVFTTKSISNLGLSGFFNIYPLDNPATPVTLSIEKNITLKGTDYESNTNVPQTVVKLLVTDSRFIMLDGSKITGHRTNTSFGTVVIAGSSTSDNLFCSRFWMFGGLITDNEDATPAADDSSGNKYASVIRIQSSANVVFFVKKGGRITGNKTQFGILDKIVDSVLIDKKRYLIEDGKEYSLPPAN